MAGLQPHMVPSMANGVSQQSPAMRLRDQVEAALNVRSTIITGVGPRTGTRHISEFGLGISIPESYDKCLPIQFDRGPDGCFGVLVLPDDIRVFNLDNGLECSVAFPAGRGWLSGSPITDIRSCVGGDYLFLCHRNKTVGMTAEVAPASDNAAYIYCRASNYEDVTTISLYCNGTSLFWKVKAPGTTAGNGPLASTNVAYALWTILRTNTPPGAANVDSNGATTWTIPNAAAQTALAAGYTIDYSGSVVRITRADGQPFTVRASDQDNAKKIYHIQGTIPRFTDLPSVFWPGAVVKVAASTEDASLEYWVRYNETDDAGKPTTGYWAECPKPGTQIALDPATMPWALQATGANTFSFGPVNWNKRPIGSVDTIPPPSFVGQTIRDMFFTAGRLGFIALDGVTTSRSNDQPFNFWRESSLNLLDTDPIDIISGGSESIMFHSVSLVGNEPVMWSGKRQYVLTMPTGEALSPRVADLKPTSSYQSPASCPPLTFGDGCYYVGPGSNFVSVNLFTLADNEERTGTSRDVSDHVPALIKGPIWQLVGSPAENMLFALGGDLRREIFIYEFLDTEQKGRVQSAWSTWTFGADDRICGMFVNNRILTFIIRRGTKLHLENMDIGSDQLVGPRADLICMDRRVSQSQCVLNYDALDGGTYITLPYALPSDIGSYSLVTTKTTTTGGIAPLEVLPLRRANDTTIKVGKDVRNTSFFIGRAPRVYVEPSEQVSRDKDGNPIFADASVASVGPILGQSSGLVMRIGSKKRRKYNKLIAIGDSLRQNETNNIQMFDPPTAFGPGTGEYVYILRSDATETTPKRFFKCAGNANDVLVAFENSGPLTFRIAGLVYMLAVKGTYTGR